MLIGAHYSRCGLLWLSMKDKIFNLNESLSLNQSMCREDECQAKHRSHMGPIDYFPLELLLNIPSSWNHIHHVHELMHPLGAGEILRSPTSLTERDVFIGILCAFVPI